MSFAVRGAVSGRRACATLVALFALLVAVLAGAPPARGGFGPVRTFGAPGGGAGKLGDGARGIAVDRSGRVFVADPANHRVQQFTTAGVFVASLYGRDDDHDGMDEPRDVAVGPDGEIYVVEGDDDRVLRLSREGTLYGVIGDGVLEEPSGVAADEAGNVYVTDEETDLVHKFSPAGALVASWGASTLEEPSGIALAAGGDVYVVDEDAPAVVGFSPSGAVLRRWGREGTGDDGLRSPNGVAVDRCGKVWVTDTGNDRLLQFSAAGELRRSFGRRGSGQGQFRRPWGIAAGPGDTLYVVDAGNHRVQALGYDTGEDPCNERPSAAFAPSPAAPAPDEVVRFDASASSDSDGSVVRYEWDLDGNGTYETDTGSAPFADRAYPTERSVVVGLRVSDDAGATATASRALTVALPAPAVGETVRAEPLSGRVLVRPAAAASTASRARAAAAPGFTVLTKPAIIPIGSTIDATEGRVRLTFATAPADRETHGPTQSGVVYGGEFVVFQSRTESLAVFRLVGDVTSCAGNARARDSQRAQAAAKARKRRARRARRQRRLWVEAQGSFRTEGRNAAAVVRGTQWLTEDRCDGTLVSVARGSVAVRDHVRQRDVTVRQGGRYFARDACASRRRFRIHLFVPPGKSVRSVEVRVGGRRMPVTYDGGYSALIDLRTRPKARFVVRIEVLLADGTHLTGRRSYRTCAKRIHSRFPPAL
jgi:DNA-binding beta-propeller fold protein YncE